MKQSQITDNLLLNLLNPGEDLLVDGGEGVGHFSCFSKVAHASCHMQGEQLCRPPQSTS